MTPAQFVQRPERWLRLISQLGITTAGGPNFMFDVVTRVVDASRLTAGSVQPARLFLQRRACLRAATLARLFDLLHPFLLQREAILPCYSLGETGRHATGSISGKAPALSTTSLVGLVHPLVSCGKPHIDCRLLIVNPASRCVVASGVPGEIWLQCASVGLGYWNEPNLTKAVFGASLADGDGVYLRTGDLAMLLDGELHIFGRLGERIGSAAPTMRHMNWNCRSSAATPGCGLHAQPCLRSNTRAARGWSSSAS